MKMTTYDHGVPSWVDLGEPDPAQAAAFYGGLFGWESEEGPPETGGYRMCMLKGEPVAGIGPLMTPGVPPFWNSYVSVDDAAAIAAKVSELGGQVLAEPMDVMGFGKMAVFADPTGAAFSVWQPGTHVGAGLVNETGTLSWNELVTTDVAAATDFYSALFGWTAETQNPGAGMEYTEWKLAGRSIAGMMAKPDMMPAEVPSHWGVYFAVDDTDAAARKVTELGGSVIMEPMDIEPGRFAVVADPAGAMFNIIKMNETAGV